MIQNLKCIVADAIKVFPYFRLAAPTKRQLWWLSKKVANDQEGSQVGTTDESVEISPLFWSVLINERQSSFNPILRRELLEHDKGPTTLYETGCKFGYTAAILVNKKIECKSCKQIKEEYTPLI